MGMSPGAGGDWRAWSLGTGVTGGRVSGGRGGGDDWRVCLWGQGRG